MFVIWKEVHGGSGYESYFHSNEGDDLFTYSLYIRVTLFYKKSKFDHLEGRLVVLARDSNLWSGPH